MSETKASGLTMSLERTEGALRNSEATFHYFARRYGVNLPTGTPKPVRNAVLERVTEEGVEYLVSGRRFRERGTTETYALLLCAVVRQFRRREGVARP